MERKREKRRERRTRRGWRGIGWTSREVFDKFPVLERVIPAFKGKITWLAGRLEGSWLDRGLERCVILRPGGFLRAEKNRRSRLLWRCDFLGVDPRRNSNCLWFLLDGCATRRRKRKRRRRGRRKDKVWKFFTTVYTVIILSQSLMKLRNLQFIRFSILS